jgi:CarboxypepD_reg-like domain
MTMPKTIIFYLLICCPDAGLSQKIIGKVVDTQHNPIAFVSIGILDKNVGTYSYEDGTFELLVNAVNSKDSLIFSAISYQKKSFLVEELWGKNLQIVLESHTITLTEVVVKSKDKPQRYGVFKKKSDSGITIKNPYGGAEVAVLISPQNTPFVAETIYLNVIAKQIDNYQLRIKFYTVNPQNNAPMDLIKMEEIIFKTSQQEGTLEIPLSDFVVFERAFYLAVEWLVEKKTSQSIQQSIATQQEIIKKYLSSICESCTVVIYDQKRISVENPNGTIVQTLKLSDNDQKTLKNTENSVPQLVFQTTKNASPTYYRSKSFGKWYRYQQSLIGGVRGY